MVNINIQKKDLWLLSAIMVFLVGVAFVIAYNSGATPDVMGHSSEELEGLGVSSPACTFCRTCGGDWPSYQGTFVDYENIARYRGNLCSGGIIQYPAFNSPQLCCK